MNEEEAVQLTLADIAEAAEEQQPPHSEAENSV